MGGLGLFFLSLCTLLSFRELDYDLLSRSLSRGYMSGCKEGKNISEVR